MSATKKDRFEDNYQVKTINKIVEKLLDTNNTDRLSSNIKKELYEYLKPYFDRINNFVEQPLKLAIIGRFSSGKTTFINRFLGLSLPVGNIPTTKIITTIKYGEKEKIEYIIRHKDQNSNSKEDSNLSKRFIRSYEYNNFEEVKKRLSEVFNEFSNSLESKFIELEEIIVYINNEKLKQFDIIDTPGLSDVDENAIKSTEKVLEKIDFGIFIFNAMQAGTADEIEILEKLRNKLGENLYAFINRADDVDNEKEMEKIKKDIKKKFSNYFVNQEILDVSCKERDEKWNSKFQNLEKDLERYILDKDIDISKKQIKKEFSNITNKLKNMKEELSIAYDNIIRRLNEEIDYLNYNNEDKMKIKNKIIKDIIIRNIEDLKKEVIKEKKYNHQSVIKFFIFNKTLSYLDKILNQIEKAYTSYFNGISKRIFDSKRYILSLLNQILNNNNILQEFTKKIENEFNKIETAIQVILENYQGNRTEGYIEGLLTNDYIYNHLDDNVILEDKIIETIERLVNNDLDMQYIVNKMKYIKSEVEKSLNEYINEIINMLNVIGE